METLQVPREFPREFPRNVPQIHPNHKNTIPSLSTTKPIHQNQPNYPPKPSIEKAAYKKYEEDKSIKDLQDYITSTYGGHYTNAGSNVQTLDLIESVGDAESFSFSNSGTTAGSADGAVTGVTLMVLHKSGSAEFPVANALPLALKSKRPTFI